MISFIIPYWGDDPYRKRAFEFVRRQFHSFFDAEVVTATGKVDDESRSGARNFAARISEGESLVFVDADSFVPPHQIKGALDIAADRGWCLPYTRYYNLTQRASDYYIRGDTAHPDWFEYEYVFPSEETPEPAVGGCVVVTRAAFEAVGGWDERFIGWGYEDRAFITALQTLAGKGSRINGPLFHLWHPTSEETRFGQPHIAHNQDLWRRYEAASGNPELMGELTKATATVDGD